MPTVRLLGASLREAAGAKEVDVSGHDVGSVLEALAARLGSPMGDKLFAEPGSEDEGRHPGLHRDLKVLVGGRSIDFSGGVETPVDAAGTVSVYFFGQRGWPGG